MVSVRLHVLLAMRFSALAMAYAVTRNERRVCEHEHEHENEKTSS